MLLMTDFCSLFFATLVSRRPKFEPFFAIEFDHHSNVQFVSTAAVQLLSTVPLGSTIVSIYFAIFVRFPSINQVQKMWLDAKESTLISCT